DKNLRYKEVEICRQISVFKDLAALIKLVKLFAINRFDIVHSTTPKAGLLSAIAALVAGVPVRLHTWTGQPWVTLSETKKYITMAADVLIGLLSTHCYADSPSQREFLIKKRIVSPKKISVINKGSISGIDLQRFHPGKMTYSEKAALKKKHKLPEDGTVITFIGRINKDKGIVELISAFNAMIDSGYEADLLLVGPMDQDSEGHDLEFHTEFKCLIDRPRIHYIGHQDKPENYLEISDLFCLPSYREGFGTTVIEAAAMGVPTLGTKINGLVDAVDDGKTGLLVEVKDASALAEGLRILLDNPRGMKQMGWNARQRCIKLFDRELINKLVRKEYITRIDQSMN
ncbi:MAG: glycosyltransferase, partial [Desulfobacterales bacterium]|nr:glycosyltransferase [Desulfobacterales bacterium]